MPPDIVDYAPLFSCPFNQPEDNDIQEFAAAYLDAVQQELDKKLQNAPEVEYAIEAGASPLKNAWSPEAGIAWKAAREDRTPQAALQLALAHARLGGKGRVFAAAPEKIRLFFEGCLFEVSGSVEITFSEGDISVAMKDQQQRIAWKKHDRSWRLHDLSFSRGQGFLNWAPLMEAGADHSSYIINSGYATTSDEYKLPDNAEKLSYISACPVDNENEIRAAQAYIRNFAPSCANWQGRVCAGFMLCGRKDETMHMSCSSFLLPGLILVGKGAPAYYCGELLVHEASHQYLNLCGLLGPLVNGRDQQLYYSPIKRAHRGIERLFFAAHANINMLLYYAEAVANGADAEVAGERAAFLLGAFNQTREPLAQTPGLAPLARAVYDQAVAELDRRDFSWIEKRKVAAGAA